MASLDKFTGTLGMQGAAHLLRRATFGPTLDQIKQFAELTADQALALLTEDSSANPEPPIDPLTMATWVDPAGMAHAGPDREQDDLFRYFQAWHLEVMCKAPPTLKERITWFFHTHLPARWTEINSSEAIYYQNCIFRYYAFGSFRTLFEKICTDNAMLRYLDGYSNRFRSPNENFAREMFELYSIGKGKQIAEGDYTNYTEDDVKVATKVLTGWMMDESYTNLDPDCGWPIGKIRTQSVDEGSGPVEVAIEHDPESKTFTEKFSSLTLGPLDLAGGYPTTESTKAELSEMMDMIFSQRETAKFIASKLYRFFVYHFISDEVKRDIIDPLAQVLLDNDFSIVELLKVLLTSEHFYDSDDALKENDNIGALIKSPVDIFTGLFRAFDISLPDRNSELNLFYQDMNFVVEMLIEQGLNFYEPFEVAGYPAYHQIPGFNRNWITTYALAYRYKVQEILLEDLAEDTEHSFHLDLLHWVENSGNISDPSDAEEVMEVFSTLLFGVELSTERYDFFLYTVFLDAVDEEPAYSLNKWKMEWQTYQGSGNGDTVRSQLELLFSTMVQTPEFQLY